MNNANRTAVIGGCSIIIFLVVFIAALLIGRYQVTLDDVLALIKGELAQSSNAYKVITELRLPRTIVAALVGISLSLSGLVYQEIFQNKLVSPDFLGVTSGSSVGAAIAILIGLSSAMVSLFAFVTGTITVFLTLALSKIFQNRSPTILLLSGIIMGGLMSAIMSLIKYLADPESTLSTITFWLMGSCASSTMNDVALLLPLVAVCATLFVLFRWRVNIIAMGRDKAISVGLNYDVYRIAIILLATLMTASAVSIVGCVGWIGLVIPHIARLIVGRNTEYTIPLVIGFGAIFMVITDILSRAFTSSEIPLSAITGLFGTVIFIVILYYKRRSIIDDTY